jgi:uncharacterized protein (UPF0335 family)
MNWFFKTVRIAGASFPGAGSLVQFQAELDAETLNERIHKLEDPISTLHEDIYDLSKEIYSELKNSDSNSLNFNETFYTNYSRALAALGSRGLITQDNVIGSRIPLGLNLVDPTYILYMASQFENQNSMQEIFDIVDRCQIGESVSAEQLSEALGLPKYVIRSVFEVFESKGFGCRSGGLTKFRYTGKA